MVLQILQLDPVQHLFSNVVPDVLEWLFESLVDPVEHRVASTVVRVLAQPFRNRGLTWYIEPIHFHCGNLTKDLYSIFTDFSQSFIRLLLHDL